MKTDPPETAIGAMLVLTALAIGLVWVVETLTKILR
jgi:hypothetical protein